MEFFAQTGRSRLRQQLGTRYVFGFNVPTIIRLLKPGEVRGGRGGS